MKKIAALTLSLFLSSGIAFADSPKDADAQPAKNTPPGKAKEAAKADKSDSAIAAEIEELRQTLQSQQEQLQLLKEELHKRDRQIDEAREAAAAANSRAAEANVKASEAVTTSSAARTATETITSNASTPIIATQAGSNDPKSKPAEDGPASIKFKGISLTPGGFIAAETIFRTRAVSGDVNTPFTGIPFNGNSLSKVSEFNFTARQSRATLLAETTIGSAKVTGYYEARLPWRRHHLEQPPEQQLRVSPTAIVRVGEFASGLSMTGGQMWSLATENKKGTSEPSGKLADANRSAIHRGIHLATCLWFPRNAKPV